MRLVAPRVGPVVRTFYDPLAYLADNKLLKSWQANWRYFGWEVEVVDLETAWAADPSRFARWESASNLYSAGDKRDCIPVLRSVVNHAGRRADGRL
jgi:hypothetical protein